MSFQENLRYYREKAGYSKAKDFAEKLGIAYGTYLPYENQGREPRYDMLVKIATLLNVSTDTLLDMPTTKTTSSISELKDVLTRALENSPSFDLETVTESDVIIRVRYSSHLQFQHLILSTDDLIKKLIHLQDSLAIRLKDCTLQEKQQWYQFFSQLITEKGFEMVRKRTDEIKLDVQKEFDSNAQTAESIQPEK